MQTSNLCRVLDIRDDSQLSTALSDRLLPVLQRSAVLQQLAALQSSLDCLDVEGLLSLNNSLEDAQVDMTDYVRFVKAHRANTGLNTLDWSAKDRFVAFLLAATFKDCSIIARLFLPPRDVPDVAATRATAISSDQVKVIDLDPKPAHRIMKWAKLDDDIVSHFADHLSRVGSDQVRRCCDG